ncbi:unnamed protein product, partial [Darwinula stevensoni]
MEHPFREPSPVMTERSPSTPRPNDSPGDHPASSAQCAVFSFNKKWIYFQARSRSIIVMVSENKQDRGRPLKTKGNKEEYPGIISAKPHENPCNVELEFHGRKDTVAFPITRICTKTKLTSAIMRGYQKERTVSRLGNRLHLGSGRRSSSFSQDIKAILKRKLSSGEDMGGQVPIVIASHDFQGTFIPANRHAYHYEVVAGQHVLIARKELHEEAEHGKDSCVCAIYMGVDEVEKRILALHNAKLEGVPYDVLDV